MDNFKFVDTGIDTSVESNFSRSRGGAFVENGDALLNNLDMRHVGDAAVCNYMEFKKSENGMLPDPLRKAKMGEGSRGGKIIGHTKSGKAIYESDSKKDKQGTRPKFVSKDLSGIHTYKVGDHHIEVNKMREGGWMAAHKESKQDIGHGITKEGALKDAVNTLKMHGIIKKSLTSQIQDAIETIDGLIKSKTVE